MKSVPAPAVAPREHEHLRILLEEKCQLRNPPISCNAAYITDLRRRDITDSGFIISWNRKNSRN